MEKHFSGSPELGALLATEPTRVLRLWMDSLRSNPTCLPTELVEELEVRSVAVLEALALALAEGEPDPSADSFRPAVRELSFVGGWLAGRGASPSLASHYLPGLGCVLRATQPGGAAGWEGWLFLECALSALVMETYCRSLKAEATQRVQGMLERCTPLVRLPGNTPALLVVGSPSREVLSALGGRVLVEAVRLGAGRVVVDLTHAAPLGDSAMEVLGDLATHRRMQGRLLVFSGVPTEMRRALGRLVGHLEGVLLADTFEEVLVTDGSQAKP